MFGVCRKKKVPFGCIAAAVMLVVMDSKGAAPAAPSNLTAEGVPGAGIKLNWAAAVDDVGVARYLVERCSGTGCAGFVQVASLPSTGMSGPLAVSGQNPRYF